MVRAVKIGNRNAEVLAFFESLPKHITVKGRKWLTHASAIRFELFHKSAGLSKTGVRNILARKGMPRA